MVKIAKALADPTRLRMLREVRKAGSLTCSQVCGLFALRQPTISHHVRTLEGAGLLRVRKRGAFHELSVDEATLRAFVDHVGAERPG
jgi:ArsR family transcriptional regulator